REPAVVSLRAFGSSRFVSLLEPIDDLLEPRMLAQRREVVVVEHPHAIAPAGANGAIEEIQRAVVFPAECCCTSRRVQGAVVIGTQRDCAIEQAIRLVSS